jgi:hypothetical protein
VGECAYTRLGPLPLVDPGPVLIVHCQPRPQLPNQGDPQQRLGTEISHNSDYHAGMEDQLGALGLVINCIALWNTVYLDRILGQLRESGHEVRDEDVARLHPYMYAHINVDGHYTFQPPNLVAGIGSRPLRNPDLPDDEE